MEISVYFENSTANYPFLSNDTSTQVDLSIYGDGGFSDPVILSLIAMSAFGFILNIASISIATRRPVFTEVPVKSLIVSLGTANLYIIVFCMLINAAWPTIGLWFNGDCRFFKTVEAFSLNAAAYIVVAFALDRCRSVVVVVPKEEKDGLESPGEKKPRHLAKLVIAAWALAVLLSLQHIFGMPVMSIISTAIVALGDPWVERIMWGVWMKNLLVVVPPDDHHDFNKTIVNRVPAIMDCVSRGHFSPPWKQAVVDFTSISTVFLVPVIFVVGCLLALMINHVRAGKKTDEFPRTSVRHFSGNSAHEASVDSDHITGLTVSLTVAFVLFWGPYYCSLILTIVGVLELDVSIITILYLVGLGYSLASAVIYLTVHLCRSANSTKDQYGLERSASSIRERIEMLQRNQQNRRFDDL